MMAAITYAVIHLVFITTNLILLCTNFHMYRWTAADKLQVCVGYVLYDGGNGYKGLQVICWRLYIVTGIVYNVYGIVCLLMHKMCFHKISSYFFVLQVCIQ